MTPPLPSLRTLTADLRHVKEAFDHPDCGGEYVSLYLEDSDVPPFEPKSWRVYPVGFNCCYTQCVGREYVPGDGEPFDAVAAARRLLAAARDVMGSRGALAEAVSVDRA